MAKYTQLSVEDYPEIVERPGVVIHNGLIITCLNEQLVERNNVSKKNFELLKALHCQLYDTYQKMEATDEPFELQALAQEVTKIEFAQQKAWNFFQDEKRHLWFDVPKCRCPKIDNMERLGTPYRIYTEDCPVHGNLYDKYAVGTSQKITDYFHQKAERKKKNV